MKFSSKLRYDKTSGNILRTLKNGKEVTCGSFDPTTGYLRMGFEGRRYYVHRIVWAIHNSDSLPKGDIDHIDGNRTNNKIENLRDVSRRENAINKQMHRDGREPGITYDKYRKNNPWYARTTLTVNGELRNIHIGSFETKELAARAYKEYHRKNKS